MAVRSASANLQKATRTEGFEGDLGVLISDKLASLHAELARFDEYQEQLGKSVGLANDALRNTAGGVDGLPETGLTTQQQSTIDMATKTGSPVQVSPGVSLTPTQAAQWYRDQAEAEQEEAARKLNEALDIRLQEIIDAMPVSEYDEKPPTKDSADGDGPSGGPAVHGPGPGGGNTGVTGPGSGGQGGTGNGGSGSGGSGNGGSGVEGPGTNNPPTITHPPIARPPLPEPPIGWVPPEEPQGPNVDGGIDGVTPPPGGTGPGGGINGPGPGGGITGPGPGGANPGPGGGVTGPGGLVGPGGAGGARVAGGLGGAGGVGGAGRVGGIGGVNGPAGAGAAGGAGGVGGVAQGGAGSGSRGMMGGVHAGAGGAAGKGRKNRRRGQDLLAYEIDDEGDEVVADLGAAGAAGSSSSDGREELGW
ncbi:hypothetical protein [Microbacterium alcoholitolerans]|uniref:hypothetical protein n=1 Tax=unclassified Microbacterium TaxID=2609290 RepID=UPI003D1850A2